MVILPLTLQTQGIDADSHTRIPGPARGRGRSRRASRSKRTRGTRGRPRARPSRGRRGRALLVLPGQRDTADARPQRPQRGGSRASLQTRRGRRRAGVRRSRAGPCRRLSLLAALALGLGTTGHRERHGGAPDGLPPGGGVARRLQPPDAGMDRGRRAAADAAGGPGRPCHGSGPAHPGDDRAGARLPCPARGRDRRRRPPRPG